MRQGAGVRGGGASSRFGAADFGEDQRLASERRLVGHGTEASRVADAFEIGEEHVRAIRFDQPVDIVMRFEAGLVPGARLIGKAQLPGTASAQKGKGQGAALAADSDRSALAAQREEALPRVVEYRAEGRDQRF